MSLRPNPRRAAPIVLVVAIVAAGAWLLFSSQGPASLAASGTVEAETIRIAPEIGGRLAEVRVEVGDSVAEGEILLVVDGSLLDPQAERAQAAVEASRQGVEAAQAGLEAARLQLEAAQAAARLQDSARESRLWRETASGDVDLATWYLSETESLLAAEDEVARAEADASDSAARLASLLEAPNHKPVRDAEARLARAQAAFLVADAAYERARVAWDPTDIFDIARETREAAEAERDAAQDAFDDLLESEAFAEVREARADVALRQALLSEALAYRDTLRVGDQSLSVRMAEVAMRQAEAAERRAQSLLAQGEAELASLEAQRERLTVRAPRNGVVLARSVEPGEVVAPGAPALTLGDLENLTITVYLAEDRYGQIALGDTARITVDSFPDETFEGTVVRIADRAEFTPRNVQTETGRRSTVFAVEVAIRDPHGRLKPGMPADVEFAGNG